MTAGSGEALRQQLTDAILQAFKDFYSGGASAYCEEGHAYGLEGWVVGRVSPVFDDLVAAARVATATEIAEISAWIDGSYSGIDAEAVTWRRVTKVCEEAGEVVQAAGGMLGENPRKGVTHTQDELIGELLDAAVAALGAVEHLTGNKGCSVDLLAAKVSKVAARARGSVPAPKGDQ